MQNRSYGERDQVAVSTQEAREFAQLHLNPLPKGSGPELVRGIAKGYRSRLSVAGPEGTLVFTYMPS